MSQRDGGDAFPSPGVILHDHMGVESQQGAYAGMTLLDYFAAAAMPIVAVAWRDTPMKAGSTVGQHAAEMAYAIAARMLVERTK